MLQICSEGAYLENMDVQLTARDNATMIENAKKTLAGISSNLNFLKSRRKKFQEKHVLNFSFCEHEPSRQSASDLRIARCFRNKELGPHVQDNGWQRRQKAWQICKQQCCLRIRLTRFFLSGIRKRIQRVWLRANERRGRWAVYDFW